MHHLPHDGNTVGAVSKYLTGEDGLSVFQCFKQRGIHNVRVMPKIKQKQAGFDLTQSFMRQAHIHSKNCSSPDNPTINLYGYLYNVQRQKTPGGDVLESLKLNDEANHAI